MSDDATPRLGLPYLAAAQAQKHVTVNEALSLIDGLVASAVTSRSVAAQPDAPADGDLYLLPDAATGSDWAGRPAGVLMRWEAGAWSALPSPRGQMLLVLDETVIVVRAAAGWIELSQALRSFANVTRLGIGTTADSTNVLSVRSAAILLAAAEADLRLTLNKAAPGATASLVFQTAFGGRAEIGLCGDDSLHVKVSPDGASWTEALTVDAASGRVGLGTAPTSRLQVEGAVRVKSYSKAALPSASGEGSGAMIHVYDDAAGSTIAFSDGGSWRRVHDRNPVA